jgi:hypothetical protein
MPCALEATSYTCTIEDYTRQVDNKQYQTRFKRCSDGKKFSTDGTFLAMATITIMKVSMLDLSFGPA